MHFRKCCQKVGCDQVEDSTADKENEEVGAADEPADTFSQGETCQQSLFKDSWSATCGFFSSCSKARGPTNCIDGVCHCRPGWCASAGKCYPQNEECHQDLTLDDSKATCSTSASAGVAGGCKWVRGPSQVNMCCLLCLLVWLIVCVC